MAQIPSLNYLTKQNFMRALIQLNKPFSTIMAKWYHYVAQAEAKKKREPAHLYSDIP